MISPSISGGISPPVQCKKNRLRSLQTLEEVHAKSEETLHLLFETKVAFHRKCLQILLTDSLKVLHHFHKTSHPVQVGRWEYFYL